jgi:Bacterial Ig-like domain (group 2)
MPVALVVSATQAALGEASSTTFTVRLSARPARDLTVDLISSDIGAASVTPSSLSFTTDNWSSAQPVIISGVLDMDLADESVAITASSAGMANQSVNAIVSDDDTQVVQMSTSSMSVTEGSSSELRVSLRFEPAGSETVSVRSNNPTVATVSPATLTFTASNYNMPQSVALIGVQDDNAAPATTMTRT